jgi:hypothetical protein
MLLNSGDNTHKILFGENIDQNLIDINILGKVYKIPSNICLLRALHYLSVCHEEFELSLRKHCWSGTCENCRCSFTDKQLGEADGLACQMDTDSGLEITKLPKTMKKNKLH